MRAITLLAQISQYPALRTEPVRPWWAEMVPWLALGLFVGSVVVAIAFLPRMLQGGMGGMAMLKTLIGDGDKTTPSGSGVDLNPGSAPSGAGTPAPASDTAAVTEPAPTWQGMDFTIFDEKTEEVPEAPAPTS